MDKRCCVFGCLMTSDDGVQLHEFPFDDEMLLPIWIMATNRPNWLPIDKSRICNKHFCSDDYEAGDKNNMLKPNACPIINNMTNGNTLTDSEDSECLSTSDIHSDDSLDTPNTSDMKSSDDDFSSISSYSNFSNSNEATGFDDDFLSSLSDTEVELDNIDIEEPVIELDSVSLSSSEASFVNTNQLSNQECAVVLCNQNARNQFDRLFFINFPNDNQALCDIWWKICGRKDKFDPLLKICSIHFYPDDFTSVTIQREGKLFKQTILNNNNIVPTLYLLPHEYTKFLRKRKRSLNDSYTGMQNNSEQNSTTEVVSCVIQGCDKTFLKDGKRILFFKFPLENKTMLKKWLDSIGLPNLQPTITDRICSDHFENNDFVMTDDIYGLSNDAVPLIKPQNPFIISSEDSHDRKHASTVNDRNIDTIFNNLEFIHLEEDILIVKDVSRENKNESLLLNSLENKFNYLGPENHKQIFNTPTDQSTSTKINRCEEQFSKTNYGDDSDTLDDVDKIQLSKHNTIESSIEKCIKPNDEEITKDECNQANLLSNPCENNCKNMPVDDSNITNLTTNKCISKVVKKSHKESFEKDTYEEKNMIPKSRNNGNDCDYIYLDMLNGDDAKYLFSFENKKISKNVKTKILKLLEKKQSDETPKSIIYDQDLTECYGEMLPPNCDPDCQLICYYSIPGPQRRQIYKEFQMLNATEQNCKITQLVQLRMSKKKDSTFESCPTYHFILDKAFIKVCKTFFINTLGISDHRLNAILKPINYSWYSDTKTALKANQPKQVTVISEPVVMTDFMKESLIPLDKDYNSYQPEGDPEVSLENVPFKEYEKVFLYMKGIPRILSSYTGPLKKHYFETSICSEYMYKAYSENFIKNKTPPPYTKRQFKKIYNQYMKTFLKMV